MRLMAPATNGRTMTVAANATSVDHPWPAVPESRADSAADGSLNRLARPAPPR